MTGPPATAASAPALPVLSSLAGSLARTALDNVVREFPYAAAHVASGPDDLVPHRSLHPAFYGSFDWHSAVHMHWLLVRLLRLHPEQVAAAQVGAVLDEHLTAPALEQEAAYLREQPSWERPYGWAWLLMLAAECATSEPSGDAAGHGDSGAARSPAGSEPQPSGEGGPRAWSRALQPAVTAVVELTLDWLPRMRYPVRDGAHANTAFSLGLMLDAAEPLGLEALATGVREWAASAYPADHDVPARWEPSGQDFLSPSLAEADLVRRLVPAERFATWLDSFLPGLTDGEPRSLLKPVEVLDRRDGLLGHLDGLNFSRAAALRSVGAALPAGDARAAVLSAAAARHAAAALPALSSDAYESGHWLGTFAALALSEPTH